MFHYDLLNHYAAGTLALHGGDVYGPPSLYAISQMLGGIEGEGLIFPYPPWALIVYAPLALFPLNIAEALWSFINLLCVIWSVRWGLFWNSKLDRRVLEPVAAITACVAFFPLLKSLYYGQITPILLFGACLFLFFHSNKKNRIAGLALSILFIKPHLLIPLLMGIFCYFSSEKSIRRLLFEGVFFGCGIQLISSGIFFPSAWLSFVRWLPAYSDYLRHWMMPALPQLLSLALGAPWIRWGAFLFGCIASAYCAKILCRCCDLGESLLFAFIPLALLFSPYAWNHDFLMLLPIFLDFVFSLQEARKATLRSLFLISFFVLNAIAFINPIYEWTTVWVPIALASYGFLRFKRAIRHPKDGFS